MNDERFTELLDEVIALAEAVGRCGSVLAAAQHHHDYKSWNRTRTAQALRDANADFGRAQRHLEIARRQLLGAMTKVLS